MESQVTEEEQQVVNTLEKVSFHKLLYLTPPRSYPVPLPKPPVDLTQVSSELSQLSQLLYLLLTPCQVSPQSATSAAETTISREESTSPATDVQLPYVELSHVPYVNDRSNHTRSGQKNKNGDSKDNEGDDDDDDNDADEGDELPQVDLKVDDHSSRNDSSSTKGIKKENYKEIWLAFQQRRSQLTSLALTLRMKASELRQNASKETEYTSKVLRWQQEYGVLLHPTQVTSSVVRRQQCLTEDSHPQLWSSLLTSRPDPDLPYSDFVDSAFAEFGWSCLREIVAPHSSSSPSSSLPSSLLPPTMLLTQFTMEQFTVHLFPGTSSASSSSIFLPLMATTKIQVSYSTSTEVKTPIAEQGGGLERKRLKVVVHKLHFSLLNSNSSADDNGSSGDGGSAGNNCEIPSSKLLQAWFQRAIMRCRLERERHHDDHHQQQEQSQQQQERHQHQNGLQHIIQVFEHIQHILFCASLRRQLTSTPPLLPPRPLVTQPITPPSLLTVEQVQTHWPNLTSYIVTFPSSTATIHGSSNVGDNNDNHGDTIAVAVVTVIGVNIEVTLSSSGSGKLLRGVTLRELKEMLSITNGIGITS